MWVCYILGMQELLYDIRFPLMLNGAVHKSFARSDILYGSEAWCLKVSWKFYEGQNDP